MFTTISKALERRAAESPSVPFARCGGDWLTYETVRRRGAALAGGLRELGLNPGDRVATLLPNREEVVEIFAASAWGGFVLTPLNAYLKGPFLWHQLQEAEPRAVIVDEPGCRALSGMLAHSAVEYVILVDSVDPSEFPCRAVDLDQLRSVPAMPAVDQKPSDLAVVSYTSGTTGMPKGCMLSHGYLTSIPGLYNQRGIFEAGARILAAMPAFHLGGMGLLMTGLMEDVSVRLEPSFSATRFMDVARADQCTMLWGTGMMALAILAQPSQDDDRTHPVSRALWVPMTEADQVRFEERFDCAVFGSYGQSEFLVIAVEDPGRPRRRTAGRPVPTAEIRIVDTDGEDVPVGQTGEIVARSRVPYSMFDGYWRQPEATATSWRGLWHHTGDMGYLDDEGELCFVDREKDAIRRRGENVSSQELEAVLRSHPAISQAAVYGIPSEMSEDDIMASLVLEEPSLSPSDLFNFMSANLPYFAIPRYVLIRDAFPMTETGKIKKEAMRNEGVTLSTWDFTAKGLMVDRAFRR